MKLISTLVAAMLLGVIAPSYGQVAFSEDFEGVTTPVLPTDWVNKSTDVTGAGWITHSGAITSANDWVMPAKGKVAVVNDWGGNTADTNNPARLSTPLIDMSALNTPYLYMDYYFVNARSGNTVETLNIEASLDSGKTWTSIKGVTAGDPYKWQKMYIDLATYKGEDAIMFAVTYSDKGITLIGAGVDNIKVFDPPAKDVEMVMATPAIGAPTNYGVNNTKVTLGCIVFNNGVDPITTVKVHYQQGSNPVVTDVITGLNIAPFTKDTFNTTTQYELTTPLGAYGINMWLELTGDVEAKNDSGKTELTTVAFMPKKKILAEEGTGAWCGWCPRGHVFMDSIAHSATLNESFSLIAIHNNYNGPDAMVVPAYAAKIGSIVGGYPGMAIDRREVFDPSELFDVYNQQNSYFGFADILLTEIPVGGFNYSVKASVKPAIDLNGDYRLAVAITEDDVTGTGSGWDQVNYYSSSINPTASRLVGSGLDWNQEPNPVPGSKMHYNHVARGIFPGVDGAAGSLPTTMTAGTTYDYTFNVQMEPWWHRYKPMHAVVMLIRNSDGVVLNSANVKVSVGVSDIESGVNELTIFPNPAANNAYINFSLTTASNVDVVITDMMGRTVQTISKENFGAGAHKLNVDLSGVTSGVYNVTVKTDSGSVSTRLSVVK